MLRKWLEETLQTLNDNEEAEKETKEGAEGQADDGLKSGRAGDEFKTG